MEKKREGDREAAGEVFLASILYITVFLVLGWERGAAKVALSLKQTNTKTNTFHPNTCVSLVLVGTNIP
jgi:hypothetical protein